MTVLERTQIHLFGGGAVTAIAIATATAAIVTTALAYKKRCESIEKRQTSTYINVCTSDES